jgi:AraC-like DNA-binding protein
MRSHDPVSAETVEREEDGACPDQPFEDCVVVNPGLQALLDDFHLTFGVHIRIFSPSDRLLLQSPAGKRSSFCGRIESKLVDPDKCVAQGKRMRHLAADRMNRLLFTCHAGLRYCLYPFVSADKLIAMAEIGNFHFGEAPSDEVLREWQKRLGEEEGLLLDFESLPRFDGSTEERLVRMFSLVVEHAVTRRLIALRQNPLFEKVVAYVRERITFPRITIEDVASHVNRSPSTISHVVKKETGITFSQLVIEEKLKAAESILVANPVKPIGDVASELGYSDQFYFSKLFKKYRGVSPSEFARGYPR